MSIQWCVAYKCLAIAIRWIIKFVKQNNMNVGIPASELEKLVLIFFENSIFLFKCQLADGVLIRQLLEQIL